MAAKRDVLEALVNHLSPVMREFGFPEYVRRLQTFHDVASSDVVCSIRMQLDKVGAAFRLGFRLCLTFRAIEELTDRYPYGSLRGQRKKDRTTLDTWMDNVYPKASAEDRARIRSGQLDPPTLARAEDARAVADLLRGRMRDYYIPFFEKYRSVEAVQANLKTFVAPTLESTGEYAAVGSSAEMDARLLVLTFVHLDDAPGLREWVPRIRERLGGIQQRFKQADVSAFDDFIRSIVEDQPRFGPI